MLYNKQEIFNSIELVSIFFILLIAIIIITAVLYHNGKKAHKLTVTSYENALIRSQYEVQEQTMQTIGADLHDNIGQLLSLTSLTLGSVEFDHTEKAKEKVGAAYDLTIRSIREMRLLGKLLQGDQLINSGLAQAIEHEVSWLERSGKYIIQFRQTGEPPMPSNPDKDLIIFRILQETLNNTIKHASATFIGIRLDYCDNNLQLAVEDNGVGFDLSCPQTGMGLMNIRKRAVIIGGQLSIHAEPNKGTQINLFIPYY